MRAPVQIWRAAGTTHCLSLGVVHANAMASLTPPQSSLNQKCVLLPSCECSNSQSKLLVKLTRCRSELPSPPLFEQCLPNRSAKTWSGWDIEVWAHQTETLLPALLLFTTS